MTFDPAKVPGGDVARWGADCRTKALAGVVAADWRAVHDWTKSWIGWGGGAWIPDTWLLYAVAALLEGKPKNAVHSLDLGLRIWLDGELDRASFTWLRGLIVMDRLSDPKTALLDLQDAVGVLPSWLGAGAEERVGRCQDQAARSRKRVPAVKPRPTFVGSGDVKHVVAPGVDDREDGSAPGTWPQVAFYFS